MILTHLVAFRFFPGAGPITATVSGPICFQAVTAVTPWVREVEVAKPWVRQVQPTTPWVQEVEPVCQ